MEAQLEEHLDRFGLALVNDKRKYRKVVAKKIIKKGTTVITSQPLCNPIIFPTHRSQHCETCFRAKGSTGPHGGNPHDLERCSVCKKRYYCNRVCFTTAWKGWHRWICPDKDMENLDYEMLKMVVIAIERLRNGSAASETSTAIPTGAHSEEDEPLELTEYVFSTLMGHEAVSDPTQLSKYREIATSVRDQLVKSKYPFKSPHSQGAPPSIQELVQYLCRFHCNNFSIHDAQLFTMAEGTFPVGALFNHSCRPNAIVMYEAQTQIVRALEDITPGQEVCTSYVDNGVQRKERRQLLAEKYYFHCMCPRCEEDEEEPMDAAKQDHHAPSSSSSSSSSSSPATKSSKWTGFRILDELIEGDQDGPRDGKIDGEWLTRQFEPIVLPNARSLQTLGPEVQPPGLITRASFTSYLIHSIVPLIQTETPEALYQERLFKIYRELQTIPHASPKPFTTTVMTHATSFFNTCLEDGSSWGLASKIGMFVLAQYLMIYPRHHPLVGLHCFTLAKSLWNDVDGGISSVRLAHEVLLLARRILRVSHGVTGQNAGLVQEVEQFMKTVETELG